MKAIRAARRPRGSAGIGRRQDVSGTDHRTGNEPCGLSATEEDGGDGGEAGFEGGRTTARAGPPAGGVGPRGCGEAACGETGPRWTSEPAVGRVTRLGGNPNGGPIIDARLADGSCVAICVPAAAPSSAVAIRRLGGRTSTVKKLTVSGSLPAPVVSGAAAVLRRGRNVLVSGGTDSVGTTRLNALVSLPRPGAATSPSRTRGSFGSIAPVACGSKRTDSARGATTGDAFPWTVLRRRVVGGNEAVVRQCIAQTAASAAMACGRTGGWSSRSGGRRPEGPTSKRRRGRRGNAAGGSGGDPPQGRPAAGGDGGSTVGRGRSHDARGSPGPGRAGLLRGVRAVRPAGAGRVGRAVRVGRAARRAAPAVALPAVRRAHGPRAHQGQGVGARWMTDRGKRRLRGSAGMTERKATTNPDRFDCHRRNTRRRAGSAVVGGCPDVGVSPDHSCTGVTANRPVMQRRRASQVLRVGAGRQPLRHDGAASATARRTLGSRSRSPAREAHVEAEAIAALWGRPPAAATRRHRCPGLEAEPLDDVLRQDRPHEARVDNAAGRHPADGSPDRARGRTGRARPGA